MGAANRPDLPWLPDALGRCARAAQGGHAYVYFVDPAGANPPGAEWQMEEHVMLDHPMEGALVPDVLTGRPIGGIEFLSRL